MQNKSKPLYIHHLGLLILSLFTIINLKITLLFKLRK